MPGRIGQIELKGRLDISEDEEEERRRPVYPRCGRLNTNRISRKRGRRNYIIQAGSSAFHDLKRAYSCTTAYSDSIAVFYLTPVTLTVVSDSISSPTTAATDIRPRV
ncbi:hypothetical protein Q3G72_019855 [Acer saccharum]|nr:hypothetical protein Q3G72_019855 [Acer saccharum]